MATTTTMPPAQTTAPRYTESSEPNVSAETTSGSTLPSSYKRAKAKREAEEAELGGTFLGKKRRARALLELRASQALGRYGELAGGVEFGDIDDPRIAEELAQRAAEDPRFKEQQMAALGGVREYVDQRGITDAERAQLAQVNRAMDERLRGQRESTMQSMAMRGMGGGGQELAAQLAGQQGAAQRQSMEQQQILEAAAGRRQQALQQLGSMSTGMRGQEFGMTEADRGAKMSLAQFNAQQRMAQQQTQNALLQQGFQNRADILGNVAGIRRQDYESMLQRRQQAKDRAAGIGGKLVETSGEVASSIASSYSDIRVKENIKEIDIKSMLDNLTPYEYNYIGDDVSNRRISPMAQDLLKSDLGSQFVFENDDGVLMVDYGKALGTMMAINANLHKRVSELEGKING